MSNQLESRKRKVIYAEWLDAYAFCTGVLTRGVIRVFDESSAVIWTVDSNVSGEQ